MKSSVSSLYVHIPFCKYICTYCDFKKFIYNQSRVDNYFCALLKQIESLNRKYLTIYIGGGTPSCIDKTNLENLLSKLSLLLDDNYQEFTIECNVENINEDFLKLIKKYKVNRLSIGIQTFNDKFIAFCGRKHNKQMAIDNIMLACKYIKNVSIDMIYAFPNQTINQLKEDIDIACSLPVKHISYYSLLIEDNTVLKMKNYQNVDDVIQSNMYRIIYDKLKDNHFHRYEISNFSKNGRYKSKHNLTYWHNECYDAVGLNSSGYVDNIRFRNNDNIVKYNNLDFRYVEQTKLSTKDQMFEEIMLRLRLNEGLDIRKYNNKYNCDFKKQYKKIIDKYLQMGLLKIEKGIIKTTFEGSLLLNSILEDFL